MATIYCSHCGKEIPADAEFCPNCGAKQPVRNQQQTTNQSSQPMGNGGQYQNNQGNYQQQNQQQYGNNGQVPEYAYNESPVPGLFTSTGLAFRDILNVDKRMGRADYWWSVLGLWLISMIGWFAIMFLLGGAAAIPDDNYSTGGTLVVVVMAILGIAIGIIELTAGIRRLHDTGRSGWFWLVNFIPIVGGIVYLVLLCQPSHQWMNRWATN